MKSFKRLAPKIKFVNSINRKEDTKIYKSALSSIIKKIEVEQCEEVEFEQYKYSIAIKSEDLQNCYKLINKIYLNKGYSKQHNYKGIIAPYDKQETTIVVAAKDQKGNVIATVSVVLNNNDLPSYKTFPNETIPLRSKTVAEVTRLVIHDKHRQSRKLLMGLFEYIYCYAYQVFECDHTLIEVNPKHSNYYKRFLFFKPLSETQKCARVQDAPALLLTLDWNTFHQITNYPQSLKHLKSSCFKELKNRKESLKNIRNEIISATESIAIAI